MKNRKRISVRIAGEKAAVLQLAEELQDQSNDNAALRIERDNLRAERDASIEVALSLREQRDHLRAVLKTLDDGINEPALGIDIVMASDAARRILATTAPLSEYDEPTQ